MYLYQADRKLSGTSVLLDVTALSDRLKSWISPGSTTDISIANVRYKPNTSCLVSYKIQTEQGVSHFHAKAFHIDDWQARKRKLDSQSGNLWIDDEFAFAAFQFPIDSELPAIKAFVDGPQIFLSSVLFDQQLAEQFESYATLSYKPNRRFAARLSFESGNQLVLKLHDQSRFQNVLKSAAALKKPLPVETPGRVGRSNRYQALAYQWIAGTTLDISAFSAQDFEKLMARVIGFLDRLQIPMTPVKTDLPLRHPSEGIDEIANYLARICPPLAAVARQICHDITAHLTTGYQPKLLHGDFHEHQIIVSKSGVQVCDFDNCCIGDPTEDLANFLAHLAYRACMNEIAFCTVELANALSKHHYSEHDQSAASRLVWNRMASLFRLATHPFRSGSIQWREETELLLHYLLAQIDSAKNTIRSTIKPVAPPHHDITGQNIRHGSDDLKHAAPICRSIQNDEALTFLSGVFDPAIAEEFLQHHCPELQTVFGPYSVSDVIARRHKQGRRCMVEFRLSTNQGPHSILGKVSAKRLDRKTFETQQALFDKHRFDYESRDGISVPRALGCCPPWKMWIQDKVVATPGSCLLDDSRLSSCNHRIAAAISKLHQSNLRPQQEHTVAHELEILSGRLSHVTEELPGEAPRIERILQNCVAISERIDESLKVAIHRDFYQDQIMFADERTYLVDIDLVKLGHPALDVGNFLAHLTEHGIRQHGDPKKWQRDTHKIRTQYLARNPHCRGREIDAFTAISFARHIFISWSRAGRRKWNSRVIEVADQMTSELTPTTRVTG